MRQRFADPLLVRTARGYVLTRLAQQLAPPVRRALSAVVRRNHTGARAWRVGLRPYADDILPPDFHYRTLFQDGHSRVCRAGHPLRRFARLAAAKLLKAAADYPQFVPPYPFGRGHVTDNVYRRLGLGAPRLCIDAPYFHAGAVVVLEGDIVAVLPLKEPRLNFEYRVIWHERVHRDSGVRWVRDLIARSAAAHEVKVGNRSPLSTQGPTASVPDAGRSGVMGGDPRAHLRDPLVRLEEALADRLCATVEMRALRKTKRGEQGALALSFDSLEELNGLLDNLGVTEC